MAAKKEKTPIDQSEVIHPPGGRRTRNAPRGQRLRVTLVLKSSPLPPGHPAEKKVKRILSARSRAGATLTQDEYEDFQCADDAHVEAVRRFARAHGLDVLEVSRARHDVVLEGSVSALNRAFHIDLRCYARGRMVYRAHPGPVHVPAELRDAVEGVFGLDTIDRVSRPHPLRGFHKRVDALSFTPPELAQYYRFPPATTGQGQRIAFVEFGGGYHQSDIVAYFKKLGRKLPAITDRCVGGAPDEAPIRNDPLDRETLRAIFQAVKADPAKAQQDFALQLDSFRDTVEVTMDLEIAGSLAPDAEFLMVFAPGTGPGLYAALHQAIAEKATIIAISWGFLECELPGQQIHALNGALHAACLKGITVCCATGDDGSRATGPDNSNGVANVAFPASSPYALACGGTTLRCAGNRIEDETVWNSTVHGARVASGGGISGWFSLPAYQRQARVPPVKSLSPKKTWLSHDKTGVAGYCGRGVPDVASNADYAAGYEILVGGRTYHGFGTSAAPPLWAALIARLNEGLGRPLGWANRAFYHPEAAQTFRSIVRGDNDVSDGTLAFYRARRGWSACTGLGTPDGVRLLRALRRLPG